MATAKNKSDFFTYKGLPFVRCKNFIYYGNPTEKHIIFITILETDGSAEELPTRVSVELLLTDETLLPNERSLKKKEKSSLYEAFDLGQVWLERANKAK
ncbi:MAG: hypothetical protein IKY33_03315 [Clostridia bacterium]|nr:hypothetical protein [Clostridia bacterium]